jgi:regulator of protease activity HflC (stomatin/prohibitin superfamily)
MRRNNVLIGFAVIAALVFGSGMFNFIGEGKSVSQLSIVNGLTLAAAWYCLNWINIIDVRVRRPVFLLGNYAYTAGPGLCLIEPLVYEVQEDVSVQDQVETFTVPNVQTKNNVGLKIDSVLTAAIDPNNVKDSVVNVEDVWSSVWTVAGSVMASVASTTDLDGLLEHRADFGQKVIAELQKKVEVWGVTIKDFKINDLKINDGEIEKAIAMSARAEQEGRAEVKRAGYQSQVADLLNEAGAKLTEPARFLRLMDQMSEMARGPNNSTFVIPSELMSAFGHSLIPK